MSVSPKKLVIIGHPNLTIGYILNFTSAHSFYSNSSTKYKRDMKQKSTLVTNDWMALYLIC